MPKMKKDNINWIDTFKFHSYGLSESLKYECSRPLQHVSTCTSFWGLQPLILLKHWVDKNGFFGLFCLLSSVLSKHFSAQNSILDLVPNRTSVPFIKALFHFMHSWCIYELAHCQAKNSWRCIKTAPLSPLSAALLPRSRDFVMLSHPFRLKFRRVRTSGNGPGNAFLLQSLGSFVVGSFGRSKVTFSSLNVGVEQTLSTQKFMFDEAENRERMTSRYDVTFKNLFLPSFYPLLSLHYWLSFFGLFCISKKPFFVSCLPSPSSLTP